MESINTNEARAAVRAALAEDVGTGDVTTLATVAPEAQARANIVARENLVACGLVFAELAFAEVSGAVKFERLVLDGARVPAGSLLARVHGNTRGILTAERTALNFLQRLAGVATLTAQFVEAVRGTRAKILDTRKTTPGWRHFEKFAVKCGGGTNHRTGLYDMVLIKDNHLAALRDAMPNPVVAAIQRARAKYPQLKIEIEADNLNQVAVAADARADVILLDNMTPLELRDAVHLVRGRCKTEASGGVTLETVRAIAESGVDFISVGALTHSARSMDIALDFEA